MIVGERRRASSTCVKDLKSINKKDAHIRLNLRR
jgi:hypothetical protein